MNVQDLIDDLQKEMIRQEFPDRPVADWKNTNHYEIQNPEVRGGYWWLDCWEALGDPALSELTIPRERLGLVLDMACAVPALLQEIRRLNGLLAQLRDAAQASPTSAKKELDKLT